jgi:hypothetical protein
MTPAAPHPEDRRADGDYGMRLGRTRSDLVPMKELGRGFDTMVARLEADEEQRRTLLADVSHELLPGCVVGVSVTLVLP